MLTDKKPNLSEMQKFGPVCYTYKQDKGKLDSRCEQGLFVGHDKNSHAYLIYHPDTEMSETQTCQICEQGKCGNTDS